MLKKLQFIFKGAQTQRFHTADMLTPQTVGAHSFGVAWLCQLIDPACSKDLIMAALSHDLSEHIVGDVSSPAKRAFPKLKQALDEVEDRLLQQHQLNWCANLNASERRILKLADIMDGMMYCIRERKLGSLASREVYHNFRSYAEIHFFKEADATDRQARELLKTINDIWSELNESK